MGYRYLISDYIAGDCRLSFDKPLSDRTRQLIQLIDDAAVRSGVRALFENDGALNGPPTIEVLERVRFSVVKLATQGSKMYHVASSITYSSIGVSSRLAHSNMEAS